MITIEAKRVFIYKHVRQIASDIFLGEGDRGSKIPHIKFRLVVCLKKMYDGFNLPNEQPLARIYNSQRTWGVSRGRGGKGFEKKLGRGRKKIEVPPPPFGGPIYAPVTI